MDPLKPIEALLPQGMLDQLEAVATDEQRLAGDVLREAVDRYLQDRRALADTDRRATPRRTPAQAADRIRERRERHPLPDGTSIRDLMTHGRA